MYVFIYLFKNMLFIYLFIYLYIYLFIYSFIYGQYKTLIQQVWGLNFDQFTTCSMLERYKQSITQKFTIYNQDSKKINILKDEH